MQTNRPQENQAQTIYKKYENLDSRYPVNGNLVWDIISSLENLATDEAYFFLNRIYSRPKAFRRDPNNQEVEYFYPNKDKRKARKYLIKSVRLGYAEAIDQLFADGDSKEEYIPLAYHFIKQKKSELAIKFLIKHFEEMISVAKDKQLEDKLEYQLLSLVKDNLNYFLSGTNAQAAIAYLQVVETEINTLKEYSFLINEKLASEMLGPLYLAIVEAYQLFKNRFNSETENLDLDKHIYRLQKKSFKMNPDFYELAEELVEKSIKQNNYPAALKYLRAFALAYFERSPHATNLQGASEAFNLQGASEALKKYHEFRDKIKMISKRFLSKESVKQLSEYDLKIGAALVKAHPYVFTVLRNGLQMQQPKNKEHSAKVINRFYENISPYLSIVDKKIPRNELINLGCLNEQMLLSDVREIKSFDEYMAVISNIQQLSTRHIAKKHMQEILANLYLNMKTYFTQDDTRNYLETCKILFQAYVSMEIKDDNIVKQLGETLLNNDADSVEQYKVAVKKTLESLDECEEKKRLLQHYEAFILYRDCKSGYGRDRALEALRKNAESSWYASYNPYASYYYAKYLQEYNQEGFFSYVHSVHYQLAIALQFGVTLAIPRLKEKYQNYEVELIPTLFIALQRSRQQDRAMIIAEINRLAEKFANKNLTQFSKMVKEDLEVFYIAYATKNTSELSKIRKKSLNNYAKWLSEVFLIEGLSPLKREEEFLQSWMGQLKHLLDNIIDSSDVNFALKNKLKQLRHRIFTKITIGSNPVYHHQYHFRWEMLDDVSELKTICNQKNNIAFELLTLMYQEIDAGINPSQDFMHQINKVFAIKQNPDKFIEGSNAKLNELQVSLAPFRGTAKDFDLHQFFDKKYHQVDIFIKKCGNNPRELKNTFVEIDSLLAELTVEAERVKELVEDYNKLINFVDKTNVWLSDLSQKIDNARQLGLHQHESVVELSKQHELMFSQQEALKNLYQKKVNTNDSFFEFDIYLLNCQHALQFLPAHAAYRDADKILQEKYRQLQQAISQPPSYDEAMNREDNERLDLPNVPSELPSYGSLYPSMQSDHEQNKTSKAKSAFMIDHKNEINFFAHSDHVVYKKENHTQHLFTEEDLLSEWKNPDVQYFIDHPVNENVDLITFPIVMETQDKALQFECEPSTHLCTTYLTLFARPKVIINMEELSEKLKK